MGVINPIAVQRKGEAVITAEGGLVTKVAGATKQMNTIALQELILILAILQILYVCSNIYSGNRVRYVGCCAWFAHTEDCSRSTAQIAPCPADCSATAPTALAYSTSTQTLSWTSGTGGVSERLYVSADKDQVDNNCALATSPGCVANDVSAVSPYSLSGLISPGTVYYARIVNYKDSTCSTPASLTFLSSCSMSSPSLNITLGVINPPSVLDVNSSSEITNTTFASSDTGTFTATSPDASYTYSTTLVSIAPGSATLTSNVYFGAVLACTSATGINVLSPDPWWQVIDSDVSAIGDLLSPVFPPHYFGLPGLGGYPGVPAYSGTTDLNKDNASAIGWVAESPISNPKTYDYGYFYNQIPADILSNKLNLIPSNTLEGADLASGGVADSSGYYWYKYDGALSGLPLTLNSAANIGSRKVILLVDNANFNVNNQINLTDGSGFFLVIVKGNIIVDPTLTGGTPDIEGLYVADGTFQSGLGVTQLTARGSVVAYGGLTLSRDLGDVDNTTTPAEVFEFAPDQIMLFPKVLSTRKINWKEVAP